MNDVETRDGATWGGPSTSSGIGPLAAGWADLFELAGILLGAFALAVTLLLAGR